MKRAAVFALLLACGGAESSALLQDASVTVDASTPVDDATVPDDDATIVEDVSQPPPKDATPPKDAGNPYVDPGIECGTAGECDPSKNLCCLTITSYYPTYAYSFACEPLSDLVQCVAGLGIYCDSDHDCPTGVCCGDLDSQNHYAKVSCKATCTGYVWPYTQVHFCDPKNPKCDGSQTCAPSQVLGDYYVCQ